MSCELGDGNSGDSEKLVTFMVFDAATEAPMEIIRGILMSRGIPFFFFAHTKGKLASICVPASRLEDARRAIARAKNIGSEIAAKGLFDG
jgi:hypothetical protein